MDDSDDDNDDRSNGKTVSLADQIAARRERERMARQHVSHRLGHRDRDWDHDEPRNHRRPEHEFGSEARRKKSETRRARKSGSESPEQRSDRKPRTHRISESVSSRKKSESEAISTEILKSEVETETQKHKTDPKSDDRNRKRPKSSSEDAVVSPSKKSKSGSAKMEFSKDIMNMIDLVAIIPYFITLATIVAEKVSWA